MWEHGGASGGGGVGGGDGGGSREVGKISQEGASHTAVTPGVWPV